MANSIRTLRDEATGKSAAYRELDDGTVVVMHPDTLDEVMRIRTVGDEVTVERAESAADLLFSGFIKEWDGNGQVGRCVKGCIQQGRGAECIAACGITNGGEGWIDW